MKSVFGQSLQLYYSRLALEHFAARKTALDALKTKEDALAYVESVQEKTAKSSKCTNSDPCMSMPLT